MRKFQLNDSTSIPAIGFGTFKIPSDGATYNAVLGALKAGYRLIDTAGLNEAEVGRAIKDSGIDRDEIFVTSKLWLEDYGQKSASKGLDKSLRRLSLDYIDLYLLHQPYGDVNGAWRALENGQAQGKIRSIGVSNMTAETWNKFVPEFSTIPTVNQVEFNPYFQQKELRKILMPLDVKLMAWGSLNQGSFELFSEPLIQQLAAKYDKKVSQIILRFENQEGVIVLPKTTQQRRIISNINIFDFELSTDELEQIRSLDRGHGISDTNKFGVKEMLLSALETRGQD